MAASRTYGARGYRVRLYARGHARRLYLSWYADGRKQRRALGHSDGTLGDQAARALVADLVATRPRLAPVLTVGELLTRYHMAVSRFKKGCQPREDRRRRDLWVAVLGADRPIETVDFPTLDRFVRARRTGQVVVVGHALSATPRERTVAADLIYLKAAYQWATTAVVGGRRLLREHPIRGYPVPRARQVRRPVATYDRFLAVRAVADPIGPQGLFGPFLDLIEGLGWRVSALCQLRVEDVDPRARPWAPHGRLRKRGLVDKEGVDQWVAVDTQVADVLAQLVTRAGVGWLFPAPRAPGQPWSRWHARDLLERAEQRAGLVPLEGGDWHPYRRKWATERKHHPTADVMQAGGWTDPRSLERAYQQADDATTFRVMTERRKLRAGPKQAQDWAQPEERPATG